MESAVSSAQDFIKKYDWREVQELLSLTSCSWLFGGEDVKQPIDPPSGMIRQIQAVFQPNAIILAPCDSGVSMDYRVVHQIIQELTVGIYCFNQVPSISLEPNPDQSSACHLTPAYCDTKVGQILINIDYTMKALWHGAYIPKEKRPCFLELWRSNMVMDPNRVPQAEKDKIAEFLAAGLVDISDDPCYQDIYEEDKHNPDPTYEPNSAEEQNFFAQYTENILLKITSYLTRVRQHENLFTFEGTYSLSNVVRLTEDTMELNTYQRLQQRLSRHMRLVKKHLGCKVELARDLAYLKLISFLVPFLIGLRKKMRIPDLSQMLLPFSGDLLKTERELPPLLLRSKFSCKHFPYKPNEYFHLHGGIEVDVGTPEMEHFTEEMKAAFMTIQNHAVSYLNDLLQDSTNKEHYPIPISEIDGKSYSVISIALTSFYPQPSSVQWWEVMNKSIKNMREQKLPLTDFQLYEQFKKTFGYAKAIQCKSVPYGLRAAAERGLSAVFHTLSRKNPLGHLGALDGRGYSLLHHAAMWNQPHIIYQLAAAGINLNQPCVGRFICSGLTPLHLAAQCGSLEALNCLIALQVDCTLVDRRGWLAVHFAAFYGQVSCVQALCRKDPGLLDIHISAEYCSTPLLLSAMSGSLEVLDYLLSNGANWRTTDSEGNNLVQLAALYFHTDILRHFIQLNLDGLPVWRILVEMLQSQENRRLEMAIRCMEALCVNADPFWEHIMNAGGISVLVNILLSARLLLQRMAAAVLCHMTKNVPVCEELVRFGAVRVLINHLSSHHPELQSRCTVILTDLAAHSGTYQAQIAELGGVAPVVQLLTSDLQDVLVNSVRCIQALCAACPQNQTTVALCGAVPPLVDLLTVNSELLQGEACLALAELARDHRENQDLIFGMFAVTPVVQVLSCRKISSQVKAAKALEAIAHQNPVIQEHFLNQSATKHLLRLLKVFDQEVREQGATALWVLAGHTLKQQKQIAELISYRFILDLLLSTSDKMQYVGCQAVIALSRDCRAHQSGLCLENGVPPLVRLLRGSRATESTVLSGITALRTLCIGVAHTNNRHSQNVIYEEKAVPTLLELLQNHRSLQVKVQVSQTLACILMGNKELQKTFWEQENFSYDVILDLLQAQDRSVCLEAGHALALFAYNNPKQQVAIKKTGGVPVQAFETFLGSDDETERAKAAFQMIVLAKAITSSDQVILTARGVTILVKLLQSDKNTTVVITAEFLASLAHTRAGIPDAVVTMGAIEHLSAHLYSEDEEVRTACANALGYLSFNCFAHRLLLVECRKNPRTYRALRDCLAKDAKICQKFTSEFKRQRKLGLPSLSFEAKCRLTVHLRSNKDAPKRRNTSSSTDRTRQAPEPHPRRSRTADPGALTRAREFSCALDLETLSLNNDM
ncbi:ankyrin and armadillo repeat-containing protein isoform X1 [Tachysurus fulvidraco]|uniref:ankyrin and armadillo repeat-containing protein isoform X1 n=1 Tax=Tachysurus fulvidraco TaxID=1234273 RepID=UPI001FEDD95E|nr:ankyrin and armadillo repeat-containing protein isoform X1 [Tachysurus fulvidraco]